MSDSTRGTYRGDGMSFAPFPNVSPDWSQDDPAHPGFVLNGLDDTPGQKAYYIHLEAKPGKEEQLQGFLRDINAGVNKEPLTGPWFMPCRILEDDVLYLRSLPGRPGPAHARPWPGRPELPQVQTSPRYAGLPGAALPARRPSRQVRGHAGPAGQACLTAECPLTRKPTQRSTAGVFASAFLLSAASVPTC